MSNASITLGMPIGEPDLADTAEHEALRSYFIWQFTSMSRRHSVKDVTFLRDNRQHATYQEKQGLTTAARSKMRVVDAIMLPRQRGLPILCHFSSRCQRVITYSSRQARR
jgi:hypothetical protein